MKANEAKESKASEIFQSNPGDLNEFLKLPKQPSSLNRCKCMLYYVTLGQSQANLVCMKVCHLEIVILSYNTAHPKPLCLSAFSSLGRV